ncbi:MAG: AI-2E family transporter, partial [Bacilli bacterium]|nr:AI-2E family transporter [Bacilli bacterium]
FLTYPFWGGLISKILSVLTPFIISFAIAYALYPFLVKLQKKGLPKMAGIGVLITIIVGGLSAIFYVLIPIIYDQIKSLVTLSIDAIKNLSADYNIDLSFIQDKLTNLNSLTSQFSDISNFGLDLITSSITFLVLSIVCFIISIYFLNEMGKIRSWIKRLLKRRKNDKRFKYVKELDNQISKYFGGLEVFMLIQFFEYSLAFMLIGHPYFLLIGILASVTTVIPYFGGIFTNILAVIMAALVSPTLFIYTLILVFILPIFDGYVLTPKVYSDSNDMHPLAIIFSVFAGSTLAGLTGIVIALPTAIILICTYRFYEKEILNKIKDYKD